LDVVSKMLLSSPDCRDGLIDLITSIITPPSPIVSLEILNPIVPRQIVDERGVELDLLLRLDDGSHINLEMQALDEAQQIARARELGMLRVSMELDEARDEGLQKGLELGQRRAQAAMIRKFMDGGMSLDQIATILKMGRDELESLLSVGRN
jgi:hypothetical protein